MFDLYYPSLDIQKRERERDNNKKHLNICKSLISPILSYSLSNCHQQQLKEKVESFDRYTIILCKWKPESHDDNDEKQKKNKQKNDHFHLV